MVRLLRERAESDYEACVARVRRAEMHLKSLETLLNRFRKSDAYELVTQLDPDTSPREIVITGRILKQPPSQRASLLIGDIVNQLRASLDNLVWALSVRHSGPAPGHPIPRGNPWRRVAFPVVLSKDDWKGVSTNALRYVEPGLLTRFYRLQPFYRRKKQPLRDPLAVLDELWNTDKHRRPHLTQVFVGLEDVLSTYPRTIISQPPGYADSLKHSYAIVSQRPRGPVKNQAELGRVIEPGLQLAPQVYMHAYLAYDIAFERRSPAQGVLVVPELKKLRDEVRMVLKSFQPDLADGIY